jgi:hypothetical protein
VVPFGKYRGQPLEALAADRAYTDWLAAQPWFRDRYASLYTIIINNFSPPSDTPEHNALQARFLQPAFCLRVVEAAYPGWAQLQAKDVIVRFKEEHRGRHYVWPSGAAFDAAQAFLVSPLYDIFTIRIQFETRGLDVSVDIGCIFAHLEARIEIKPSLGDEYPTVLRQMKRSGANLLFCGEYVGSGISQKTLISIFDNERIRLVLLADLGE